MKIWLFATSLAVTSLFFTHLSVDAQEYKYSAGPGDLIVGFIEYSGAPYLGEPSLGLKIYGDGRIIATLPEHYPEKAIRRRQQTVTRRGVFEARITINEINSFLDKIEQIYDVDIEEIRDQKAAFYRGKNYSDFNLVKISISLEDYRPSHGEWAGPIRRDLEVKSPLIEMNMYPRVDGVMAIGNVYKAFLDFTFLIAAQVCEEEAGA